MCGGASLLTPNWLVRSHGRREAATAPVYRLHALPTQPPKPGMVRVAVRTDDAAHVPDRPTELGQGRGQARQGPGVARVDQGDAVVFEDGVRLDPEQLDDVDVRGDRRLGHGTGVSHLAVSVTTLLAYGPLRRASIGA